MHKLDPPTTVAVPGADGNVPADHAQKALLARAHAVPEISTSDRYSCPISASCCDVEGIGEQAGDVDMLAAGEVAPTARKFGKRRTRSPSIPHDSTTRDDPAPGRPFDRSFPFAIVPGSIGLRATLLGARRRGQCDHRRSGTTVLPAATDLSSRWTSSLDRLGRCGHRRQNMWWVTPLALVTTSDSN